jgi:hypothetical protein
MSTQRQQDANARNARSSTGPRTPEGRAAVSSNALKHGLTAARVLEAGHLMPGECAEDFESLRDEIEAQLAPAGAMEEALVGRVISSLWRLRRIVAIESGLLAYYLDRAQRERPGGPREVTVLKRRQVGSATPPEPDEPDELVRAEPTQTIVPPASSPMRGVVTRGHAFVLMSRGDSFSKLSRYEAGLERSLLKALHELQRLQEVRAGNTVTPPVVVDVLVTASDE